MTTTIPLYPARPVNGGNYMGAPPKIGRWAYEPKINGWRGLLCLETGTLWNRKGELSTLRQDGDYTDAITEALIHFVDISSGYLDIEILGRRNNVLKGHVAVLDLITTDDTYSVRRHEIVKRLPLLNMEFDPDEMNADYDPHPRVFALPILGFSDVADERKLDHWWAYMRTFNAVHGVEFFEGFVAKRMDSRYPSQTESPSKEFPGWVKHRFKTESY